MYALDVLAIMALVVGAYLGAKKGLWRLAAGCSAVALGAAAGWATSDVLAAALRDWGVGSPGDAIVGFFLPFALTSVYARFIIGLWLSRKLKEKPGHDRLLGAAAGLVWMVFLAGSVARAAGLDQDAAATAAATRAAYHELGAPGPGDSAGPFTQWLARWPGAVGARMYLSSLERGHDEEFAGTVRRTLDADRARRRAGDADAEAITSMREAGFVRLGLHPAHDDDR
ncbi:MAG: CvpA family protein [Planctomycetota bacterium]|jgi:hypothetical protein